MTKATISRAQQLAVEFAAVNDGILDTVAEATPRQWQSVTESERWPAGVVAHHIAEVERFFTGVLTRLGDGAAAPMALRGTDVDANNARHAAEFAQVGKAETLAVLGANGAALAERIRELDDEQLDRVAVVFDGQDLTGEQVVAMAVIAHLQEHLGSLRQALAG
jgi:hypothetical protein